MNKKLWTSVALTALIAFPAGWAFGNGAINKGLVNALASVGENLFGDGNFDASIVGGNPPDDNSPATQVVQIDLAASNPPDDNIPVYLNVFQPPDPHMPGSCRVVAQVAVTSEGVSVYSEATGAVMSHIAPMGAPPNPCDDGTVIGPGGPG